MANTFVVPRNVIIFSLLVPAAVLIGYLLAEPLDPLSFVVVVGALFLLCLPLLMRWHHLLLVVSWNASVLLFFLPGQPRMWMAFAVLSLGFSVLNRIMDKSKRFLSASSLTWSLLAIGGVVVFTAQMTGGAGLHSMGGDTYGGKRYFELLMAVAGYFALTAQRIPPARVGFYLALFLLSGMTSLVSNVIYLFPSLWWLYLMFPADFALNQAAADFSVTSGDMLRLNGVAFACIGPYLFMIGHYGIRGIFDLTKPWRLLVVVLLVVASMFGGFRSVLVLFALLFVVQFFLEGLHRTRLMPILMMAGVLVMAAVIPNSTKMPLAIQRSLSFLPMEINPIAKIDADGSTDWRVRMWKVLLPDLPKYLFVGKGYKLNPTDLYLTHEAVMRGLASDIDGSLLAGDYHNGPLSVYVPFGSPGLLALIVIWVAGIRVLVLNYRFGDPALRLPNTFLLAYFLTRIIFFIFIFGSISNDLANFAGILGMSVSLNGGVRRRSTADEPVPAALPAPALQPAN